MPCKYGTIPYAGAGRVKYIFHFWSQVLHERPTVLDQLFAHCVKVGSSINS